MSILDNIRRDAKNRLGKFLSSQTGNAPVMFMLGGFKFSIASAAVQEWSRSTSYRWAAQERFGKVDALQFTGYGPERWTLPCIVFPDWQGIRSTYQIIAVAPENKPLKLISAMGNVIGQYVIESIEETQSNFKPDGNARRLEFVMTIRAFD